LRRKIEEGKIGGGTKDRSREEEKRRRKERKIIERSYSEDRVKTEEEEGRNCSGGIIG